ncbi:MAG: isoprenylcysteine carboxylmethyltransferase family protein [Hamadaea sp.]|nr:isoprenylcysteine carboxylmethyltransferase family protein [Hamadaea sp.]
MSATRFGGRGRAAAGSLLFLVIAPGTVAGVIPWWLTDGWRSGWDGGAAGVAAIVLRSAGGLLLAAGIAGLLWCFGQFVWEGRGTPAPVAPTRRLVVGGLYRFVRNPMYVAIIVTVVGEALLLGRPVLLAYAVVTWLVPAAFVRFYEEPTLLRAYGDDYREYRAHVPGWLPRPTPWKPPTMTRWTRDGS